MLQLKRSDKTPKTPTAHQKYNHVFSCEIIKACLCSITKAWARLKQVYLVQGIYTPIGGLKKVQPLDLGPPYLTHTRQHLAYALW